ncbi:unnamed protein product [Gongylonema pulchrum]|uniref:GLOBIN domain-containing protein n=1 Tax=Gongylonema pulchrum TaxID=637853 RepID=A0A183CX16_9BILA|nr:unnamed protein product [Gongylonema pulchrum]
MKKIKRLTLLRELCVSRKSWNRVPKAKIGDAIFAGMVTRCSDAKTMFGDETSLSRHLRHFAGLLQSKHWDAFGESLVIAVNEYIAPGRAHKDTLKAWMLLSSFLSDRLGAASKTAAFSPLSTPRIQLFTLMASAPYPS